MSLALIRQAFESRLNTWALAQTPPVKVVFENTALSQAPAGVYLRAYILPGQTVGIDLAGALESEVGVFQISVAAPIGVGTKQVSDIIDALRAVFPKSTTITAPSVSPTVRLWLRQPLSAAPAVQEPDRYVVPVSAPYQCLAF